MCWSYFHNLSNAVWWSTCILLDMNALLHCNEPPKGCLVACMQATEYVCSIRYVCSLEYVPDLLNVFLFKWHVFLARSTRESFGWHGSTWHVLLASSGAWFYAMQEHGTTIDKNWIYREAWPWPWGGTATPEAEARLCNHVSNVCNHA